MKMSLRFTAGALLALIMQAVCFGQHYTQTNLVSTTSGVAPVTLSPGNVSPTNSDAAAAPAAQVYFTAGPTHGSGGLFGYLAAVSSELTEGSNRHS